MKALAIYLVFFLPAWIVLRGEECDSTNFETEYVPGYDFIRYTANNIQLNGDDWDDLTAKFRNSMCEPFTIVHIGDSHLQADIATGEVRRLVQAEKQSAGRGLIMPCKLASTNEPTDYRITLDCEAQGSRLLKKPWLTDMSFTGIGVSPQVNTFNLTVEQLDPAQPPFRFLRVYAKGDFQITDCISAGLTSSFTVDCDSIEGYTDVFLDFATPQATLSFYAPSTVTLFGLMLSAEQPGVFYHVIGNNGATYDTYNELDRFAQNIATLYPDLIIVSLGTNDAYAHYSDELFRQHIDTFITRLMEQNPEAHLLLTTPKECQRKTGRRHRGRKARFTVVDDCKRMRNIILDYASEKNLPVYDWFEVAGGDGASNRWLDSRLLSQDRVHDTHEGYIAAGRLFHSALQRALNKE